MKQFKTTDEYKEELRGMKLSDSSRTRMEKELLEYAHFHPVSSSESGAVRVGEQSRSIKRIPQSGILSFIQISNWKLKPMTALILIVLLAGGSTSFAAEHAVPGDTLYPMKVEVNEEIKSMFALSNKDEAALQARLMEERLEEAETLASRGELTADAAADLGLRMKAHMTEAEERSEKAEANGDFETAASVRASLDASLRSYTAILGSLSGNTSNTGAATLITDLNAMTAVTANPNVSESFNASVDADVKSSVEATLHTAADIVGKAQAQFAAKKAELSASARATIEARLEKAVAASLQAETSFRAGAYDAAYTAAQTAMSIGGEVRTMIESALRIDLNLDTTVDSVLDNNLYGNEPDATEGSSSMNLNVDTDTSVDSDLIDTKVDMESHTNIGGSGVLGL